MLFSNSLRTALVALAVAASAASAAPAAAGTTSLKLTTAGPGAVNGVEDLKVVTTLTNAGDETVKLLNHPSSILGTLPCDTFTITNDAGATPGFIGVRVKYSPTQAATSTDPSAVTFIAPGKSVSFTHDLSAAYNFTSTGYGTYTIAPSDLLHAVGANNEISEIHADVEPFAAAITGGKLVVARPRSVGGSLTKRATFTNCTSSQQTQANTAASGAQNYASTTLTYLRASTNTTRFRTWFGSYDGDRHSTVLDHFGRINANNFANFQYDCSCTTAGVYAYVYPDEFGTVNLCPLFWPAPQTGTDSKAGTLIHEASHFTANGGTFDIAYGQADAQALALAFPEGAVINADSHQYFAENNPALP